MIRYSNDRAPIDGSARTFPAGYDTGGAYFARETEARFHRRWLFAGRDDDASRSEQVIASYHEGLRCPMVHPQRNRPSRDAPSDNEPPHPTWLELVIAFDHWVVERVGSP
jgi:hypothetical protein